MTRFIFVQGSIKEEWMVLIIDSQATTKEKIGVAIEALKQFDLGDIHVMPVIRDLLERSKE